MHYGFAALDLLPDSTDGKLITDRQMFRLNYGFVLNLIFLAASGVLGWLWWQGRSDSSHDHDHEGDDPSQMERILLGLSVLAAIWLLAG